MKIKMLSRFTYFMLHENRSAGGPSFYTGGDERCMSKSTLLLNNASQRAAVQLCRVRSFPSTGHISEQHHVPAAVWLQSSL